MKVSLIAGALLLAGMAAPSVDAMPLFGKTTPGLTDPRAAVQWIMRAAAVGI